MKPGIYHQLEILVETHKNRLLRRFGIINTKHQGKRKNNNQQLPFHFIKGVSIWEGLNLKMANDFLVS